MLKRVVLFVISSLLLTGCSIYLVGCATASSVRKQVAKDLTEIVGYQDCETTCYALRAYLKNKYGISIEEVSEPEVAHK